MGNIVRSRKTQDRIKAERTLVTVRAAGAFKSKVTSVKKKTAAKEIEEIIEWNLEGKTPGLDNIKVDVLQLMKWKKNLWTIQTRKLLSLYAGMCNKKTVRQL